MFDTINRALRAVDLWIGFRCERCQRVVKVHVKGYLGDADLEWQVYCGCGGRCKKLTTPVAPVT